VRSPSQKRPRAAHLHQQGPLYEVDGARSGYFCTEILRALRPENYVPWFIKTGARGLIRRRLAYRWMNTPRGCVSPARSENGGSPQATLSSGRIAYRYTSWGVCAVILNDRALCELMGNLPNAWPDVRNWLTLVNPGLSSSSTCLVDATQPRQ